MSQTTQCSLRHAILESGMDVGIVNAHEMLTVEEVEAELLEACEDLVFNRNEEATEHILELTQKEKMYIEQRKKGGAVWVKEKSWRDLDVIKRL